MRIAIVTQPLISNYGGLLQNWGLQTVLRREYPGVDVVTFDQVDSVAPLYLRIGSAIKRMLTLHGTAEHQLSKFDCFRNEQINATAKAKSLRDFKRLDRRYAPKAYIVGSDQVWRPSMVHDLEANFLSFTKCSTKIAYAASFGVDSWEFSTKQTQRCRKLLRNFTAVSVREIDGVSLCEKYLDCKACHVLDPTLLLGADDYANIISDDSCASMDYVFTYILDSDSGKRSFVGSCTDVLSERNAAHDVNGNMPSEALSVEEWLVGIRDASMVICDSFHGVAFSIIFNKEFYVLGNSLRGNSRLNSLLTLFGLNERMVSTYAEAKTLSPIDWERVNLLRNKLVSESLNFLHSAL